MIKHLLIKAFVVLLAVLMFSTTRAATITVNTNDDNETGNPVCELRSAILAANGDEQVQGCSAGSGPDTIEFSISGSIQLELDLPDITEDLIINGPGTDQLTIDGNNLYRQFVFAPGSGSHEIRDLTLSQGLHDTFGGCLRTDATHVLIQDMVFTACQSGVIGGALLAAADTDIERALFFENTATGGSGGGAIFTHGTHNIRASSFVSNNALGGTSNGGGVGISSADVTISLSTFASNSADQHGGGIALYSEGSLSIISSTVSNNTANAEQSGAGHGGGIFIQTGSFVLENTVIAGNEDKSSVVLHPDLSISSPLSVTTNGYNFIGDNTGSASDFPIGNPNASRDRVGITGATLNALLEPLANYGGTTPSMPPQPDSPLVDAGDCPSEVTDQRGFSNPNTGMRVFNLSPANYADGCDIGAVELAPPELMLSDGFESDPV